MKAGELVSDDLIMGIMGDRLKEDDCKSGYLLDGFPRTIPQAEALKVLLADMGEELGAVVSIEVPRDVILDRLTTRRTCTDCGEIYNVKSKPPKEEGKCDKCGGVVQRDDETEEAIGNRLDVSTSKLHLWLASMKKKVIFFQLQRLQVMLLLMQLRNISVFNRFTLQSFIKREAIASLFYCPYFIVCQV